MAFATAGCEPPATLRLLWSSIDNDDSRDLDQIEWAERAGGKIRVPGGHSPIVDSAVAKGTPVDRYAALENHHGLRRRTHVPHAARATLTDLTSLSEAASATSVVIEFVVAADGSFGSTAIYRARVRNHAQLTYTAWVHGWKARPPLPQKLRRRRSCRRNSNCKMKRRRGCARRGTGWAH